MCMVGLRIEPEAHGTIRGLVCDKDVGSDVGAGRITGGHDGRPDDIGISGDARRRRVELRDNGCQAVVPQVKEMCMVGPWIESVVHSTI
jgi:hypothetical protein